VAGNDCNTSRQVSVDLNGEFIDGTVLSQAGIAFKNIFATLKKAGFEKKMTSFK
jgi:enamine deaminase RidA (YjgF/YER057c/UK114 family)